MREHLIFIAVASLVICPMVSVARGALDVSEVIIVTEYEHIDGVPVSGTPWDFEVEVELASPGTLDHIDLTIPGAGSPSYALTEEEPNLWFLDPGSYASLAALRADFPEGVYTLEFRDGSNGLLRTISLNSSGLATPTDVVNFTYPSVDGQTGVNVYPTFTWTVAAEGGDILSVFLDDLSSDETVSGLEVAPTSMTSWTPGALLPNHDYDLNIDVATIKDWVGPDFPVTTVDSDVFTYVVAITYFNEIRFVTGSHGPVYRFWSPQNSRHFYTISQAEKDYVEATYPANIWTYETVAYYAFAGNTEAGLAPVYRFWSNALSAHFYTISEAERDYVIDNLPAWAYEGPVFYAYPPGSQPVDASPVYRFWSETLSTHFYTISETEKDYVINNLPAWEYETVAWYAYE